MRPPPDQHDVARRPTNIYQGGLELDQSLDVRPLELDGLLWREEGLVAQFRRSFERDGRLIVPGALRSGSPRRRKPLYLGQWSTRERQKGHGNHEEDGGGTWRCPHGVISSRAGQVTTADGTDRRRGWIITAAKDMGGAGLRMARYDRPDAHE
jgi:hypothetical protein